MQVLSLLRYLFPRFARKRHGNEHFSFPSGHITCVKQVRRPGQGIVAGPTDRQEVARSGSAMSALGQKQTFAVQKGMSALPPITTSIAFFGMSALGQKRTFRHSLDYRVSKGQKLIRDIQFERLC